MNQSIGGKIFKYTMKAIGFLLVFGTIGILLWRMFSSGDPASMKTLDANATLLEAYEKALSEDRALDIFTQEQPTNITTAEHNYSYFSARNVVFVRDAKQVQLTFRYNNSTIRHLVEDYKLSKTPAREEDLYDVTLWVVYDLTPDVKEDNEIDHENVQKVRVHATVSETRADQKSLYNYRKLVFDGVDFSNPDAPILAIYMDVYYNEDIDYEADPYGTLPLYQKVYEEEGVNKPYELTKQDQKAIDAFKEQ